MSTENYKQINLNLWDARVDEHLKSDFYKHEDFMNGASSLNEIELSLLGELKGKKVLHLQCHFGQDSISLSRMGAKVTGVDFSQKSIDIGKKLAQDLGEDTTFICADVYDLPEQLNEQFDIVFTSYGTIIWLPDLDKWAKVISRFLKPQGKFVFAEFHPFVWMFDDDHEKITFHYHNEEPIIEVEEGTYANPKAEINQQCITWNHGMGEVLNSLINNQMIIKDLQEYNYAPYPFVKNTKEYEANRYRIEPFGDKVPLVYSICAVKNE